VVQIAGRQIGGVGNLAHAGGGEAARTKHAGGGAEDLDAAGIGVVADPPRAGAAG
jgi:hypothetical protein